MTGEELRNATHEQHVENTAEFGAYFLSEVEKLLLAMGYEKQGGTDDWLFGFCVQKVEERIKNACNVPRVPHGLNRIAICLMAGEFLKTKMASGNMAGLNGISLDPMIKQIEEGDTNIVYAVSEDSTTGARLGAYIAALDAEAQAQFVTYRRLKW